MDQRVLRAQYEALLARLHHDERVLGVVLTGSQARQGTATERSDYDIRIIVADEYAIDLGSEGRRDAAFDVSVLGLTAFRHHGLPGTESSWDRYSYAYSQVELDRDGSISALVAQKATLGEEEAAAMAPRLLDQFLNSIYRCLKNERDGRELAAAMDSAEAVRPMIGYLFALCGRVEPYNKYLEWELRQFPLPIPGWDREQVRGVIAALLQPAEVAGGARSAYAAIEATAIAHGHHHVILDWGDDVRLMQGSTNDSHNP